MAKTNKSAELHQIMQYPWSKSQVRFSTNITSNDFEMRECISKHPTENHHTQHQTHIQSLEGKKGPNDTVYLYMSSLKKWAAFVRSRTNVYDISLSTPTALHKSPDFFLWYNPSILWKYYNSGQHQQTLYTVLEQACFKQSTNNW